MEKELECEKAMGEKARAENMGKEWVEELELRKAKIMEQVMEMELVEEQAEELEQHMASDKEFRAARE